VVTKPLRGPKGSAHETARERFGTFAERYVTSQAHAEGEDLERLVEIAEPRPEWLVLDVATGGGHTALRFAPLVGRVVATDLTARMLAAARTHIAAQGVDNVTFGVADAQDLPFQGERFDLVTCRIAPHHFGDCARFVRESTRVLKKGGMLLVQDHVLPEDRAAARYVDAFERLRDPSHHRAYAESEWVKLFRDAGLAVEQTEQLVKEHQFLPWAKRQDCSPETIARLIERVERAPGAVVDWMRPRGFDVLASASAPGPAGAPGASFLNHHILLAGRKGKGP
jgi:ubiquinone/menaquinone biosynthesis C-methylase UbiE